MYTTSATLLDQLRQVDAQQAWVRLVQLYTPLLHHWARRRGLQDSDAADLVQDVFLVLVRRLPEFTYDQHKSFRNWLRTVLHNKWRDRLRHQATRPRETDQPFADVAGDDLADGLEETEYRQHLVRRALQLMQAKFAPKTWKACWEHVVQDRPAEEVAAELGISVGSVYVAKARVLGRLRQDLAGLMD
jgi:RNA polymerase sigma-70 factor (ECF subfamily)